MLMPFFQNRRNLIIAGIVLFLILPIILSLLSLWKGRIGLNQKKATSSAPVKIAIPSTPPSKVDLKKDLLRCPATSDFCTNAKDVNQNNIYLGIGANIATGSAVYAAFDGNITALKAKLSSDLGGEEIIVIYLDNKEKGLRAVYTLKGQVPQAKSVRSGGTISKVGDRINVFGSSLIFKLIKGNPINGEVIKLTPANFIK